MNTHKSTNGKGRGEKWKETEMHTRVYDKTVALEKMKPDWRAEEDERAENRRTQLEGARHTASKKAVQGAICRKSVDY